MNTFTHVFSKKRTGLTFEQRLARGAATRYQPSPFGSCMRCQMRWDEVEGHSTPYGETKGCFPLCEECWSDLTPEFRLPFYSALWHQWKADEQRYNFQDSSKTPEVWEMLKSNVLNGL